MQIEGLPQVERRLDALPSIPLGITRPGDGSGDRRVPEAERLALVDQALGSLILRVANTPLYGKNGSVGTVSEAVNLLGAGIVRRMAAGLRDTAELPRHAGVDRPRFFEHFVASAAGCRALARHLGCAPPEAAHTAGLLHSIGQAIFDQSDPQGYANVVSRAAAEGRPIYEIEREMLGTDHASIGRLLAERWHFPAVLVGAIAHHQRPQDAGADVPEEVRTLAEIVASVDGVLSATGLVTCCRNGKDAGTVAGTTVTPEAIALVQDAARRGLREAAALLGLESDGEHPFAESVREAARRLVAMPATTAMMLRPVMAESITELTGTLRDLRGLASNDEAWDAGLRGIRNALVVDRVFFYSYDAERGRLDLLHALDDTGLARRGESGGGSDLPMAAGGALSHAVRDGRAVLVDDLGADAPFLRSMGVGGLAAAPVYVLERTHGIVTVDNLFTRKELTDHDAAMLGLFTTELGLAMENLLLHKQAVKLRALAERDELTGVNNRRNLMTLFQREMDRARRYGSEMSVCMVDIDFFKSFNDTYGHLAGDDVLRNIAQVLVSASREIDIIGRYGGEEFMGLLPETGLAAASVYAERLRARVEGRGKDLKSRFPNAPSLTISVGVTEVNVSTGDDIEKVIARVDDALYKAKEQGRNRVVIADTLLGT
jgi:diguanylate cyclase (GGDEF)-like protein/putative nucleotidyltransferase with HDIG domain